MKTLAFLLFPLFLTFSPLMATPEAGTTILERFLCSDAQTYVLLRSECYNPGSYYQSQTKTWLIEHPKDPAAATPPRKTLLLDKTDHFDVDDPRQKTSTVHFKDQKTALGDILDRYRVAALTPWTKEQTATLRFDGITGLTEYKSQRLWAGFPQEKQAVGDAARETDYALVEVAEDQNCIFLTIRKGWDENSETTMVCIPASITRNVHALRELEPFHLSAGFYPTEKEALSRCESLRKSTKDLRFVDIQVWSVFQAATGKTEYAVILPNTASFLRSDILGDKQKSADHPNWIPISSEGFRELIANSVP
jgi:hypothetical protein